VPKAPLVDILKGKENELKNMKAFSLKKSEFNLDTYWGRFKHMYTRINPTLFFVSKKTIETCKEKVDAFKMREEASNRINSKVYLKEDEVKDMIKCNRIVGSAVHPDTGKIVPFYMRMSGFVIFNMPIVFAVLFTRN